MYHPGRFYAAVIQARFATRKRTAIVRSNHDHGILQNALSLQLCRHQTNEVIETAHLVVVAGKILAGYCCIHQVRRNDDLVDAVNGRVITFLPITVSVTRSESEEEGLVLGSVLNVPHPIPFFAWTTAASDFIKGTILIPKHMVFAGKYGVVTGCPQQLGETDLTVW